MFATFENTTHEIVWTQLKQIRNENEIKKINIESLKEGKKEIMIKIGTFLDKDFWTPPHAPLPPTSYNQCISYLSHG